MISSGFLLGGIELRSQPHIFFQKISRYLLPFTSCQMHRILLSSLIAHYYRTKNQILKLFEILVMLHSNLTMRLRSLPQFIEFYTNFYNQLSKNQNSGIKRFEFVILF